MKFSNLLSFGEDNVFNFEDEILCDVLIQGNNGDGKSGILDILSTALYDRPLRTHLKENIINDSKEKFNLELTFMIDEDKYRIEKSGKHNTMTDKYDAKNNRIDVYKNNKLISKNKIREINIMIENIIGLSFDEFNFMCIMSHSMEDIIDMSNLDRKKIMTQIINIDYLIDIEKQIKQEIEVIKATFYKNKYKWDDIIEKYNTQQIYDPNDLIKIEKTIKKQKDKINKMRENIKAQNKQVKYIDIKHVVDTYIKNNIQTIRKELISNKKELNVINKNLNKTEDEYKNIITEESKKNIWEICQNTYNKTTHKLLEDHIVKILKENIDIVQEKHNIEVELIKKKNIIEQIIIKKEIELQKNIKEMEDYKKNKKIIKKNEIINNRIDVLNKKLREEENILEELNKQLIKYHEYKSNRITEEMYNETKTQNDKYKKNIEMMEVYQKIMTTNALPFSIIKMSCDHIEKSTNNILKLFGVDFTIKLENDSSQKKDLITYLNIYKRIGIKKTDAKLTSTSEKFMINLAFKIAIQNIFNISIPKVLFIDEQFENIDNNKRKNILNILNTIHTSYNNIYIISHLREITELCKRSINIRKEHGISYII